MVDRAVRRAALSVVIGIALGATLVWATLTTTRVECVSPASGSTPLGGPPFDLNSPSEGRAGGSFYYNFTVGASSGGLTIGDLNLQVQTLGGAAVPASRISSVTVISITTSAIYAAYNYAASAWAITGNPTDTLNTTMSINFVATSSLSGDELVASVTGSGACPFSGMAIEEIPIP